MKGEGRAWALALSLLLFRVGEALRDGLKGVVGLDFPSFWTASRVVAEGGDPYGRWLLEDFRRFAPGIQGGEEAYPFLYPPPALLLWSWTRGLDYHLAQGAWRLLMIGASLALARRLALAAGLNLPLVVAACLAFAPLGQDLELGQVNVLLTLLLVEGVLRSSGSALAAAVLLKISPVLALPAAFVRSTKKLHFLAAGTGMAALLVGLGLAMDGPGPWSSFWETLRMMWGGRYAFESRPESMYNVGISRILMLTWPEGANAVRQGLAGLGVLAVAASAWRGREQADEGLRVAGAAGALMVLVAPVAWFHHLCLALPGLAWARRGLGGRIWWALALPLAVPQFWWLPVSWVLPEVLPPLSMLPSLAACGLFLACLRGPRAQ